ncbi:hypothetical protein ACOMHN_042075 [Nucella lapillus]
MLTQHPSFWSLLGLLLLLLMLALGPMHVTGNATADLTKVQEDFFKWHVEQSPEFSTYTNIRTYNDRVNDLSLDVFDPQRTKAQQFLTRAKSIDKSQLSRQHRYSYDIFIDTLNTFVTNYRWRFHGPVNPVNFLEGFYLDMESTVSSTPLDTRKDFENYLSRLQAWPTQISQMMDRMDKAISNGTTNHNVSMKAVPGQISKVTSRDPLQSALYKPFTDKLTAMDIPQQHKSSFRTQAHTALQDIWTTLGRLKTYIENTYIPATRATYGVYGLPMGRENYRACLSWHLSVNLTPEQVHQTGLREVDRITQLMRQVMAKQGFNGSVKEYYGQLRKDPRFQLNSAKDILKAYENLIYNKTYPKLPLLFKDIPQRKVIVKPLSYDGPYGMYMEGSEDGTRPGTFFVNIIRPNETKTYTMVSLTLHEAVPGHHLQSIYQQTSKLPNFQKYMDYGLYSIPYAFPFYTAYIEGWALYAEYLGEEMGVYANDYELMGRYRDEIFRACRLVVDTGIHYQGWSRKKAIQYLGDRTPMSDNEVAIEIDRYITWPGQACAYKIGELKIKELRQRATQKLGEKFDIRDFHSLLLTSGPVPLSVMEEIVNDYITEKKVTGTAAHLSMSSVGPCFLVVMMWISTQQ